jgi:hypothetical protein
MTKEQEAQALALLRRKGDFTDEEYDLMDEYVSTHDIEVDISKPGILGRNSGHLIDVDALSSAYLRAKAEAAHTTPSAIVGELVRERIAATA